MQDIFANLDFKLKEDNLIDVEKESIIDERVEISDVRNLENRESYNLAKQCYKQPGTKLLASLTLGGNDKNKVMNLIIKTAEEREETLDEETLRLLTLGYYIYFSPNSHIIYYSYDCWNIKPTGEKIERTPFSGSLVNVMARTENGDLTYDTIPAKALMLFDETEYENRQKLITLMAKFFGYSNPPHHYANFRKEFYK